MISFVKGFVKHDGVGVEGATISYDYGAVATTLADGSYVGVIPAGIYNFTASKPGVGTATFNNVTCNPYAVVNLDFSI